MDGNDEISIKVRIYDKVYPMKVLRSEEYIVRKAAKIVNDSIGRYFRDYRGFDMQMILSMLLIDTMIEHLHVLEDEGRVRADIRQILSKRKG